MAVALAAGLSGCGTVTTIYPAEHWTDETLEGFTYNPNVSRANNLAKIANPGSQIVDVKLPEGFDYDKAKAMQWEHPLQDSLIATGTLVGGMSPITYLLWLNNTHSVFNDQSERTNGIALVPSEKASTWAEAAMWLLEELNTAARKTLVDMGHSEDQIKDFSQDLSAEKIAASKKAEFIYLESGAQRDGQYKGKPAVLRDHLVSGLYAYSLNRPKVIPPSWLAADGRAYWVVDYAATQYELSHDGKFTLSSSDPEVGDRKQEFLAHYIKHMPEKFWQFVPPFRTSKGSAGPYVIERNHVNLFIQPPKGDLGEWKKDDFAKYVK